MIAFAIRFFYGLLAWINRHVTRLFTRPGRFLLAILAVSAMVGLDTTQSVAYQVFTLVASIIGISFLASFTMRGRFEGRRMLPLSATVGDPISYRVTIRNLDRKWYGGLTVSEDGLDAGQSLRVPETPLPDLAPLAGIDVDVQVTPSHRGKLHLNRLCVFRPDPLGIARRPVALPVHSSILVLPKRYPVPPLSLPGTRRYQPGGVALSSSIGESLEFSSLRDYRPGDPVRRIHWRSWARTGKLVVKEYEDEYFVRHALLLDTFPSATRPEIFEEAVSVAASFACSVLTQESLLDLLFVGAETYCFTAGRGLGGPEKMLEVLACVSPCTQRSFRDLHHSVISRHSTLSGCICVLLDWDEQRREFVHHLDALRVPALVCVIADAIEPGVRNVHILQPGKIAEGLARV